MATKSILEQPKTSLSTFASTFKKQKEEVWSILAIVHETSRGAEHKRYVFLVTPVPKSADGRKFTNQVELFQSKSVKIIFG